jgi:very-short-patch-repair endonuclease
VEAVMANPSIPANVAQFLQRASVDRGRIEAERFGDEMYCQIVERPIDSPIEQLFFIAAHMLCEAHHIEVDPEPLEISGRMRVGHGVHLHPQRKVGKYTVDFLVTRTWTAHNLKFGTPGTDCQRSVIVELDGHDFHDRDKHQRSYEKARDRFLQREGFRVLHFTGADVVADPYRVAHEAIDAVDGFDAPEGHTPYDASNPLGFE